MKFKNQILGPACIALALLFAIPATSAAETGTGSATGTASWYGGIFHGRLTASGERFDKYALTAAHRTLPFGTFLKVTNRNNGKSVIVRINDRGPFAGKRLIDLSRGAADRLDMVHDGTATVDLTLIKS